MFDWVLNTHLILIKSRCKDLEFSGQNIGEITEAATGGVP